MIAGKDGKCIANPTVVYAIGKDASSLPKCETKRLGETRYIDRHGLVVCDKSLSWRPVSLDPIGTSKNNPATGCGEVATLYPAKTDEFGMYWVSGDNGDSEEVYCNRKTGKKADAGSKATTAGKDCVDLLNKGVKENGVYWIDPDGQGAFQVYCDQDTSHDGGGWIMLTHTKQNMGGGSPCGMTSEFRQSWNNWWEKVGRVPFHAENFIVISLLRLFQESLCFLDGFLGPPRFLIHVFGRLKIGQSLVVHF